MTGKGSHRHRDKAIDATFHYLSEITGGGSEDAIAALRLGADGILLYSWESTFVHLSHDGFLGRPLQAEDGYGHIFGMLVSGEPDPKMVGGGLDALWSAVLPMIWRPYIPNILHKWIPNLITVPVLAATMYDLRHEIRPGRRFTTTPDVTLDRAGMGNVVEVILAS